MFGHFLDRVAVGHEFGELEVNSFAGVAHDAAVDVKNVGDVATFVFAGLEDHSHEAVSVFEGDG